MIMKILFTYQQNKNNNQNNIAFMRLWTCIILQICCILKMFKNLHGQQ